MRRSATSFLSFAILRLAILRLAILGLAVFGLAFRGPLENAMALVEAGPAGSGGRRLITAIQLEQMIGARDGKVGHDKSDSNLAHELGQLQLTERVNESELSRLEKALPGNKSRRALRLLADQAAFLVTSEGQRIDGPVPEKAERQKILSLMVEYVKRTITKLPNFYATRNTIWFADLPAIEESESQPLQVVGTANYTVLYRDGKEVIDASRGKNGSAETGKRGVVTSGEYGPILLTAVVDLSQGSVFWSGWEKMDDLEGGAGKGGEGQSKDGETRRQAVFRFSVPRNKSHYGVSVCCTGNEREGKQVNKFPAYHGEIAIDPETGSIRRLMLRADLEPTDMVSRADTVVNFGPVEIGGATYICPLRSVSLSVEPMRERVSYRSAYLSGGNLESGEAKSLGVLKPSKYQQTFISDVVFDRYHLFRAESRMIVGDN